MMRFVSLAILCLVAPAFSLLDNGAKVYVYDLPEKFNYALFDDVSCGWHVRGFDHYFDGMGSPAPFDLSQNSIRNNDQYTYEIVIHQRMLTYENRVYDKSEADLFYVPFYLGYALHVNLMLGADKETQESNMKTLSVQLLDYLRTSEGVTDDMWDSHFMTVGREEGMFFGGRFELFLDEELAPLKDMLRIHYRQDCRTEFDAPWSYNQTCPLEHNFEVVVAPQIATVHAVVDEPLPWTVEHERPHIATFVGNDRRNRHHIVEQLRPEHCSNCRLEIGDDPNVPDGPTVQQVVEAYSTSEFCLHPWGDGPLRRGIYDSITLGCIPVFFIHARKPWDTFIDYNEFAVWIEPEDQYNVIEKLQEISHAQKQGLRDGLNKYAQYFQWSFGNPPVVDAFDIMMTEVSYVAEQRANRAVGAGYAEHCDECKLVAQKFSGSTGVDRALEVPEYRPLKPDCNFDAETDKDKKIQLLQASGTFPICSRIEKGRFFEQKKLLEAPSLEHVTNMTDIDLLQQLPISIFFDSIDKCCSFCLSRRPCWNWDFAFVGDICTIHGPGARKLFSDDHARNEVEFDRERQNPGGGPPGGVPPGGGGGPRGGRDLEAPNGSATLGDAIEGGEIAGNDAGDLNNADKSEAGAITTGTGVGALVGDDDAGDLKGPGKASGALETGSQSASLGK